MEPLARIRLLEHAASELLESETNGSLVMGVSGSDCEPLVVTAVGCSVLVAVGRRSPILIAIASLGRGGRSGPRALAEGCDRTLRRVHDLPSGFVPTLSFADPVNARRFAEWLS
ncbi:MAG TPA: hypothetical protein VND54_10865 [Candidatus Saccharimonadales bacterium]|nr:hypothetical protein [Candidatus Saccharimonadales bacterium]